MKKIIILFALIGVFILPKNGLQAQRKGRSTTSSSSSSLFKDSTFLGLKFRNIGPAFMSGRIADIAIHPVNDNIWYVAVGSGGVWKTMNAGTTWKPVFDDQPVYSIGCVTIDPLNPEIIWVGTGENVGGRHMGFGDGVYKSVNGGESWRNMGLKKSEHISEIIVHPENSDIVWLAAQGPLWTKGGERGFYKSTDGGKSWKKTLGNSEWTGVTDIAIDPRNPDKMFAVTWDRHRTVAAYMGGGPGSGIHRSYDGGETWEKLTKGLPKTNIAKTGIAISPMKPDIIYAAVETDRRTGGLFKSIDGGSTWNKMSDAVTGGTGPHYYQELYASPHQFDKLYLVDNHMQVSADGGKTFTRLNRADKHGDNHSVTFRKDDPNYLLVGTDGGVYESFDLAKTWRFMENLPITQFYKLALDDAEPFYNIYGGTQDNSTEGGPSRTDNEHGIQNSDWKVILNWDGHQPATEPGNPDIVYAERQQGTLSRVDITTGEVIDIQPQAGEDEPYERYNWDAPILVSPHAPTTIFHASQRVWKSENRGDSWKAISGDLTKDLKRIEMPIMGKRQSWDEAWDVFAMSNYSTITSLAESPKQAGLIYAGTDDGLIQVTDNNGDNWRKINVNALPGVPSTAFVNDIKADMFDANTVYVALDNHKYGDFRPYLYKSSDKGVTWKSIVGNLPQKTLVWRLVQDHVNAKLMFAATEFGIYFTVSGGSKWTKLGGGIPTISFRDIAIQKRENDLVGASFGRGFFILDDYSALRDVSEQQLNASASLFKPRKAWWYVPRPILSFDNARGTQGSDHFVAPNPAFGAEFTYYLKDDLKSQKDLRTEAEKGLRKQNANIPFPGWDQLEVEKNEDKPKLVFVIKDNSGSVVRRVRTDGKKGFNRIAWDLRYPAPDPIVLDAKLSDNGDDPDQGLMAAPGTFTATMYSSVKGKLSQLADPVTFEVEPLRKGALEGASPTVAASFWREYETVVRSNSATQMVIKKGFSRIKALQKALANSTSDIGEMDDNLASLKNELIALDKALNGSSAKNEIGEKTPTTISSRIFTLYLGVSRSTYGPTTTQKETIKIVNKQLKAIQTKWNSIDANLSKMAKSLLAAGSPWIEGEVLPDGN